MFNNSILVCVIV